MFFHMMIQQVRLRAMRTQIIQLQLQIVLHRLFYFFVGIFLLLTRQQENSTDLILLDFA